MKRTIIALGAIALALALTGGAWAGKRYLITSSSQVRPGALTGSDIKNHSLDDLSKRARNALQGEQGPVGPAGVQGPKGDTGPQGPRGSTWHTRSVAARPYRRLLGYECQRCDFARWSSVRPVLGRRSLGRLCRYDGADGLTLSQITQLSYKVMYSAADTAPIREAYLRIFLNDDSHDVIFDATKCATVVPDKNVFTTFEVDGSDSVRYDDDACTSGDQTWADVVAAHGSDAISGIYVTTGFTGGSDLTALLRSLSVNGHTFTFGG